MKLLARTLPVGSIALLLSTTAALADVTAQDVWADWKAAVQALGTMTISTGSEDYAGGVLTVRDFNYVSETDEGTTRGNVPEVVFTERGDGSVAVTISPEQTVQFTSIPEWGDDAVQLDLVAQQTDMVTTVTGVPGAMNYAVSAANVTIRIEQLLYDDDPVDASGTIVLSDISGSLDRTVQGDLSEMTYTFATGAMNLKGNLNEPDGDGTLQVSGNYDSVSGEGQITWPAEFDPDDPGAMFAAGFALRYASEMTGSVTHFALDDDDDVVTADLRLGNIENNATINNDAFAYQLGLRDLSLDMTSQEFPFPVAVSASELGLGVSMPLTPTTEPAPFTTVLSLAGVTVGDPIWDMLDPTRAVPRDPVTAVVDLSGTATLTRDLFELTDEMEMEEPPGMLNTLSINTVDIAFGGATAHADGAFTFDPKAAAAFDDMPMPTGQVTATITGLNGLLRKLSDAGLLPSEQAMGVTMMLGMFAVPSGDDEMTSTIEITPDGQVMANGMPLPM